VLTDFFSSKLSSSSTSEAQEAVLNFFGAPPGYVVVFTANCTGALKLVGESFPFSEGSSFVLGKDSHNSVHGIREYARRAGSNVSYINATPTGGLDPVLAKVSSRVFPRR
jgi:selenocysteine lyase/cysteine desulfurase